MRRDPSHNRFMEGFLKLSIYFIIYSYSLAPRQTLQYLRSTSCSRETHTYIVMIVTTVSITPIIRLSSGSEVLAL